MPKIVASKDDWLTAGMHQFAHFGADQIRVEQLASALQCNKASFYWHFKSRENFIRQLLEKWMQQATVQIIDEADQAVTPEEKFKRLIDIVFSIRKEGDLMFHLRKLADKDSFAAQILAEAERKRVAYIQRIIQELGYSPEYAAEKAEWCYTYYLGWYERHKDQPLTPVQLPAIYRAMQQIIGKTIIK